MIKTLLILVDNLMTTIMIVDDQESLSTILEVVLENEYKIIKANNGREGLELFQRHRPALIITDNRMPEMNGSEMINAIRKIDNSVKIIVLASYSDRELRTLLANGADICLPKPITVNTLVAAIKDLLSGGASRSSKAC
ncbi:MAG: response regulator [Acidobacteriota bacterium]